MSILLWYAFLALVLVLAVVFDIVGYLAIFMIVVCLVWIAALFVDWDHLSDRGF